MMVLLALFGGTALLLYGIRLSGEGLQRATGARLRHLLTGLSRSRPMAVVSGVVVTGLLQSSAATTIMLIGFVSAGLMTFRQTLGVILGGDIGTTLTVQLIAFKITNYAVLLVGVGFTTMYLAGFDRRFRALERIRRWQLRRPLRVRPPTALRRQSLRTLVSCLRLRNPISEDTRVRCQVQCRRQPLPPSAMAA